MNNKDNHFSLIIDIVTYARSFTCKMCTSVFTRKLAATTHTFLKGDAAQFKFAGEPFVQSKTVFDKLDDIGVYVAKEKRFYPYRITYDIETYMDANWVPADTPKFSYEAVMARLNFAPKSCGPPHNFVVWIYC